ncbi:unnamed protein product, partial [Polarella glacialis]
GPPPGNQPTSGSASEPSAAAPLSDEKPKSAVPAPPPEVTPRGGEGPAQRALLIQMSAGSLGHSGGSSASLTDDVRLNRLRSLLREALRLCPQALLGAREHLQAAQARIEEYAAEVAPEEDQNPLG